MEKADSLSVAEQWRKTLEAQTASYDVSALGRDVRQVISEELRSYYLRKVLEYAQLGEGALILEPGCGSGRRSVSLGTLGHQVVLFDYTPQILHNARQLARNAKVTWSAFVWGNLEYLPFDNNTFDLVFNEGVVEHWLDAGRRAHVFREMVRVTKPGGTVSIVVPNGSHLLHSWWQRLGYDAEGVPMFNFGPDELAQHLRRSGLRDIEVGGSEQRPWSMINHWPRNIVFRLIAAAAHRLLPVPARLNAKLNVNLLGLGRKPTRPPRLSRPSN